MVVVDGPGMVARFVFDVDCPRNRCKSVSTGFIRTVPFNALLRCNTREKERNWEEDRLILIIQHMGLVKICALVDKLFVFVSIRKKIIKRFAALKQKTFKCSQADSESIKMNIFNYYLNSSN